MQHTCCTKTAAGVKLKSHSTETICLDLLLPPQSVLGVQVTPTVCCFSLSSHPPRSSCIRWLGEGKVMPSWT